MICRIVLGSQSCFIRWVALAMIIQRTHHLLPFAIKNSELRMKVLCIVHDFRLENAENKVMVTSFCAQVLNQFLWVQQTVASAWKMLIWKLLRVKLVRVKLHLLKSLLIPNLMARLMWWYEKWSWALFDFILFIMWECCQAPCFP